MDRHVPFNATNGDRIVTLIVFNYVRGVHFIFYALDGVVIAIDVFKTYLAIMDYESQTFICNLQLY